MFSGIDGRTDEQIEPNFGHGSNCRGNSLARRQLPRQRKSLFEEVAPQVINSAASLIELSCACHSGRRPCLTATPRLPMSPASRPAKHPGMLPQNLLVFQCMKRSILLMPPPPLHGIFAEFFTYRWIRILPGRCAQYLSQSRHRRQRVPARLKLLDFVSTLT